MSTTCKAQNDLGKNYETIKKIEIDLKKDKTFFLPFIFKRTCLLNCRIKTDKLRKLPS